ncbi:MAG: hypothetical protein AB7O24_28890 [Kofleriaceae bacterium]
MMSSIYMSFAVLGSLAMIASVPRLASAAPTTPDSFVLIVTNNRSVELGRPDLSYADDDGAKYYETFRTAVPEANVQLLTELDRDTARLFPSIAGVVQPPTKQALWVAAANIATKVADARRAGRTAELTFVFAGHGDVDDGRGFLELRDGRFTAEDLEALITKVGATRSHVILDSCNSFFVINARKPGGRRFATPKDAAESLSKRLPNVGVFLSTSAEAEVFEWSELQSGIFSHAVRSGLSGAADVNGDGAVSYEELGAFVDTATAEIKNPVYRPKVFARGPQGKAAATLFSPGHATLGRFELDRERSLRVTLRDADDLPWIDVFKEAGTPMAVWLPARLREGVIEELEVTTSGSRTLARRRIDASFAAGEIVAGAGAARGPSDLFKMMFTRPFGPSALAAYRTAEANQPPIVFGVSREDTERMSLLLSNIGEVEHRSRITGSSGLVGLGALLVGGGLVLTYGTLPDGTRAPEDVRPWGWAPVGIGVGVMALGGFGLLRPGPAERLHERFAHGLASGEDPSVVVEEIDRELRALALSYRRTRKLGGLAGIFIATTGTVIAVRTRLNGRSDDDMETWIYGGLALTGVWAAIFSRFEYPIEGMARMWSADPTTKRLPQLSIAPAANGNGAVLGISGQF